MKKYQENKIYLPFKAARENEALQATSKSFRIICKKRISTLKYKQALKQFLKEFKLYEKTNK